MRLNLSLVTCLRIRLNDLLPQLQDVQVSRSVFQIAFGQWIGGLLEHRALAVGFLKDVGGWRGDEGLLAGAATAPSTQLSRLGYPEFQRLFGQNLNLLAGLGLRPVRASDRRTTSLPIQAR